MYDWKVSLKKGVIHGGIALIGIGIAGLTAFIGDPHNAVVIAAHVPFAAYLVPPAFAALVAGFNNLRKNYEP